jgi:hypothetical protein
MNSGSTPFPSYTFRWSLPQHHENAQRLLGIESRRSTSRTIESEPPSNKHARWFLGPLELERHNSRTCSTVELKFCNSYSHYSWQFSSFREVEVKNQLLIIKKLYDQYKSYEAPHYAKHLNQEPKVHTRRIFPDLKKPRGQHEHWKSGIQGLPPLPLTTCPAVSEAFHFAGCVCMCVCEQMNKTSTLESNIKIINVHTWNVSILENHLKFSLESGIRINAYTLTNICLLWTSTNL